MIEREHRITMAIYFKVTLGAFLACLYLLIAGYTYGVCYKIYFDYFIQTRYEYSAQDHAEVGAFFGALGWPAWWLCHWGYQMSQGK